MTEVRVGPAGAGAETVVRVGDVLVVELPENATTGFVWTAEAVPDELVELPDGAPPQGASAQAGAARGRVLRFGAGRPGSGELLLRHARAWEDEPLETLVLPVRVEAAVEAAG